jgi:hypothetical protein
MHTIFRQVALLTALFNLSPTRCLGGKNLLSVAFPIILHIVWCHYNRLTQLHELRPSLVDVRWGHRYHAISRASPTCRTNQLGQYLRHCGSLAWPINWRKVSNGELCLRIRIYPTSLLDSHGNKRKVAHGDFSPICEDSRGKVSGIEFI